MVQRDAGMLPPSWSTQYPVPQWRQDGLGSHDHVLVVGLDGNRGRRRLRESDHRSHCTARLLLSFAREKDDDRERGATIEKLRCHGNLRRDLGDVHFASLNQQLSVSTFVYLAKQFWFFEVSHYSREMGVVFASA